MAKIKEYIYHLFRQVKDEAGGEPRMYLLSTHYDEDSAEKLRHFYKGSEGKGVTFKVKRSELVQ